MFDLSFILLLTNLLQYNVCLFGFYRPINTIKVILSWSVNLRTCLLGRLRPPKQLTSLSPVTDNYLNQWLLRVKE